MSGKEIRPRLREMGPAGGQKTGRMKDATGFTLIELLIVVAIIAILAAIAVPNFLEAQTRAKISRVKADQRTIATALESYAIDYNKPPTGTFEWRFGDPRWGPCNGCGNAFPSDASQTQVDWMWSHLTTPVSYLTSIPEDPFTVVGGTQVGGEARVPIFDPNYYVYETYSNAEGTGVVTGTGTKASRISPDFGLAHSLGFSWSLTGTGPSREAQFVDRALVSVWIITGKKNRYPNGIYEPTNGTISRGRIIRTNKGIAPDGIQAQQ